MMLRFTNKLALSKAVTPQTPVLRLTFRYQYSGQECKPPQRKPPPKKSKLPYILGAVALGSVATIGYAKYDPMFRASLVEVVPFVDDVIKFVFMEDNPNAPTVASIFEGVQRSLTSGEDKKPKSVVGKKDYAAPAPLIPILEKEHKPEEEQYVEIRIEEKDHQVGVAGEKPHDPLPESHFSNLGELEKAILDSATQSVTAYNKAVADLKAYSHEVTTIMEASVDEIKPTAWDSIRQKSRRKEESLKKAESAATEAADKVERLKKLVEKTDCSQQQKDMINLSIQKVQDDIATAKKNFNRQKKTSSVTERYWDKVLKARQHFSEEIEILFPTVDISKKNMSIHNEDLDLLVTYLYAHVLFYQKELAKLDTIIKDKVDLAIELARKGDNKALSEAQICEAVEKEKRKHTLCFQKQCLKLRQQAEMNLREQLKRQSQTFYDQLEEKVRLRTAEIERDVARKFDEHLEQEKIQYKQKLASMMGRLKAVDLALKEKETNDKLSKQSQVLWAACQGLLRAIRTGCPGISWKEQLRPLEPEIDAIKKAAEKGDALVEVVIAGIPQEAKERGVYPEDALRERFKKVEDTARGVALVPDSGASLPVYLLSYIQSMMLIKAASPIPKSELNNEEVDFSKMNTNEILQRARYWLDRGDLEQTLKYMNLLKGAPRAVAKQWMEEARILLETQLAANALLAHASSGGLVYL